MPTILFPLRQRDMGALSSAGRASALQAEGHRFEPYSAHHIFGPVVQLVRMPACHAGGRGFEPPSGSPYCTFGYSIYASVAQSVEQGTENPRVGGSIPPGGTKFLLKKKFVCGSGSVVERRLAKANVASSNLVFRSNAKKVHNRVPFLRCLFICI